MGSTPKPPIALFSFIFSSLVVVLRYFSNIKYYRAGIISILRKTMPSLWVWKVKVLAAQLCPTLWDSMDCSPTRFLCLWDSPGKNTGVVAIPFSRGSSQPRDWTQVSCIAGRLFTSEPPRKPCVGRKGRWSIWQDTWDNKDEKDLYSVPSTWQIGKMFERIDVQLN